MSCLVFSLIGPRCAFVIDLEQRAIRALIMIFHVWMFPGIYSLLSCLMTWFPAYRGCPLLAYFLFVGQQESIENSPVESLITCVELQFKSCSWPYCVVKCEQPLKFWCGVIPSTCRSFRALNCCSSAFSGWHDLGLACLSYKCQRLIWFRRLLRLKIIQGQAEAVVISSIKTWRKFNSPLCLVGGGGKAEKAEVEAKFELKS